MRLHLVPGRQPPDLLELPWDVPLERWDSPRLVRTAAHRAASLLEPAERERGTTFEAQVDVTEWLGHEQFAYVPFEAPPEVAQKLRELAQELDSDALRTQLVVSLDSASRVREGEQGLAVVRPEVVHLFDPSSGENLTLAAGEKAEGPAT